jgi:DNA-binding beta-propeller fold protein YncE
MDGTTGTLTPVAGSPFPAGSDPVWVAVDPTGQFVYVANNISGDVSAYTIDGTSGGH